MTPVQRVVLVAMLGQSNGEGRALPYSPRLDPPDPGVLMWDWATHRLTTATVPLSSPQRQAGFSPITRIARRHREAEGFTTPVVIVNAAAGGSGLVAEPPQGSWRVGYRGPGPQLQEAAIAAIDAATAAVVEGYGVRPEIWLYWHQGEADLDTPEASYADAIDRLCASLRDHLGDADIPFTAGGMVPEAETSAAVRRALVQLPARLEYAAYADGIRNGGDDLETGVVHYVREAAERLGDAMFEAGRRAAIASANSVPHKPLDVTVDYVRGMLRLHWSAPMCRWSGFEVQCSIDGAPWTTVPRAVPCALDERIEGVTGAYAAVRVATVNRGRRSAFTDPVELDLR